MKTSLKELRARANITQHQMAKLIGINQATYNAWEKLSVNDVEKVAKIFGLKTEDLAVPRKN